MSTLTLRLVKGTPLTNSELDANFTNLNTDKLEVSTAASTYAPKNGTGASGTWDISITGNAATVTNGLYSTGSYSNPSWLTALAGSKISGNISGNAANITGIAAIANGGTGSSTASGARTNLDVPSNSEAQDMAIAMAIALG